MLFAPTPAECTGYEESFSRRRRVSANSGSVRKASHAENVQLEGRPRGHIAAHDGQIKGGCQTGGGREKAFDLRHRAMGWGYKIDQGKRRVGAHGGDITEHTADGFMADGGRLRTGFEMNALDNRIRCQNEIMISAGRRVDNGGVVTGPDQDGRVLGGTWRRTEQIAETT